MTSPVGAHDVGDLIADRYEVLERLDHTAAGQVLKARDTQHDRLVAVKVRQAASMPDRRALLRATRLLLELRPHPNLPQVREDFFDDDRYVVVVGWVQGQDLASVVRQDGAPGLPVPHVLHHLDPVADALDHMHDHDPPVVHQDVTPANILVTDHDRSVLVGYGRTNVEDQRSEASAYLAPEVVRGAEPGPASDVYGLAATLLTAATGHVPNGHPPPWEAVPANVRDALARVLAAGLATDPGERPTAGALLEPLRSAVEDDGAAAETGQRRLVAVWLAELVDPTGASTRLFEQAARERVEAHGGTLVRATGGRLLAHSPSTAQAVDSALAVRGVLAQHAGDEDDGSPLRVTIHLGDVVVTPERLDGHGVRIATRLLEEAEPGDILVSEEVWRQCRRRSELTLVPLDQRTVEVAGEPIDVWTVAPADDVGALDHLTTRPSDDELNPSGVAVLPFDVIGGAGQAEMLAAGLQDDVIDQLSQLASLTVISSASVAAYGDNGKPIPRIARELNVATVVEGSLQAAGDRVRLTVKVIDGVRDHQIWADTYDRELTARDLFSIRSELSRRIVESLHAKLSPSEEHRLNAPPPTDDLEAYRLAVEGRMQLDRKTQEGLSRAVQLFEQALQIDPEFVTAWTGLADSLIDMHGYGYGGEEVLERGERALRRALELDPDSAGAHASLGLMLGHVRSDSPGAIEAYQRALDLNPGYADAHNWHAWESLLAGRGEEALEHAVRALQLNPLSAEATGNAALAYCAVGQPERGVVEGRRMQELSPDFPSGRFLTGVALYEAGRFSDAVAVLSPRIVDAWAGLGPDVTLALSHVADGSPDQARRVLDDIDPEAEPFFAGAILAALGHHDDALDTFDAVDQVGYWPALAIHHLYDRVWEPLRDDARFDELRAHALRSRGVDVADGDAT